MSYKEFFLVFLNQMWLFDDLKKICYNFVKLCYSSDNFSCCLSYYSTVSQLCRVSHRLFRLGRSPDRIIILKQTPVLLRLGQPFVFPSVLSRFLILSSFCCDRHQKFRICFISFVFCLICSQCNADLGEPLDVAKISLFCRNFC